MTKAIKEFRKMEVRALEQNPDNQEMIIEGRAITYDLPTVMYEIDGVEYREVIERGALEGCDMSDVPFRYNHSEHVMIMARTRSKTLELMIDEQGLTYRAKLADTTAGRDLFTLVKRNDVNEMSFAFTVKDEFYDRENRTRRIRKFKKIWDLSGVDMPAYDNTSISARSFFELEREKERKELESSELRKKLILKTLL